MPYRFRWLWLLLIKEGLSVLDLSSTLSSEYFTWPEEGKAAVYPNEHLKLKGRMVVVKSLAEGTALKEFSLNF